MLGTICANLGCKAEVPLAWEDFRSVCGEGEVKKIGTADDESPPFCKLFILRLVLRSSTAKAPSWDERYTDTQVLSSR